MPKHKKKKKGFFGRLCCFMMIVAAIPLLCYGIREWSGASTRISGGEKPVIEEHFLEPNRYSRPQIALKKVNGIVIHYTANPGTGAMQTRNYFNGLKDSGETFASSHFVIDTDGTIVQCIPLEEIAYCSNDRNYDTISIECCHEKKDGKFTQEEYESLKRLTKWLCGKYRIKKDQILRHYDITGKKCPLYYVEHPEKWEAFLEEIDT